MAYLSAVSLLDIYLLGFHTESYGLRMTVIPFQTGSLRKTHEPARDVVITLTFARAAPMRLGVSNHATTHSYYCMYERICLAVHFSATRRNDAYIITRVFVHLYPHMSMTT
jgi:hypothetical protein